MNLEREGELEGNMVRRLVKTGLVLGIVGLLHSANSQTNTDFRMVSNEVYNVRTSIQWQTFPPNDHWDRHTNWGPRFEAEVVGVISSNKVVVRHVTRWDGTNNWWNARAVICDYPKTLAVGDNLPRDKFFELDFEQTVTNEVGRIQKLPVYTYGKVVAER